MTKNGPCAGGILASVSGLTTDILARRLASVGPGRSPLVARAWDAITATGGRVSQVKEKFGGLRIYSNLEGPVRIDVHPLVAGAGSYQIGSPTALSALLNEIDAQSLRTCERCGAPGGLTAARWVKTLCAEHAKSYAAGDDRWDPAATWDWRAGAAGAP